MTLIPQEDKDVHGARQRARQLYEQGSALDAIARSVKTSVMSVLRWRRHDQARGAPWLRAGELTPQERMRARLYRHLEVLIDAAESRRKQTRARYPTLEDRMLRVCQVIEHLGPDAEDLTAQLRAMERFAAFCPGALCEEEMGPVRKAVRMFLDHLKASAI